MFWAVHTLSEPYVAAGRVTLRIPAAVRSHIVGALGSAGELVSVRGKLETAGAREEG